MSQNFGSPAPAPAASTGGTFLADGREIKQQYFVKTIESNENIEYIAHDIDDTKIIAVDAMLYRAGSMGNIKKPSAENGFEVNVKRGNINLVPYADANVAYKELHVLITYLA